jgi:hypothetical protein
MVLQLPQEHTDRLQRMRELRRILDEEGPRFGDEVEAEYQALRRKMQGEFQPLVRALAQAGVLLALVRESDHDFLPQGWEYVEFEVQDAVAEDGIRLVCGGWRGGAIASEAAVAGP